MEQKTDYIFKEEQIDWNALAKVGIGKEQLAQDGNLDLLLQGRETDILPVRLKTAVIDLATDATLCIVENPAGIPVVEINVTIRFYLLVIRHRPTSVGIFISCCPHSLFAGDCGKAWREKIPERSEDDFFPANQPEGPPCAISPANGYFYGKK